MSSAFDIQGRNCIFQMMIDDVYQDVLCAKTFSFNRVYELKETTTVLSGFDKEYRPRKKSYTISFNGVVQVEADANKPTIKTLFDYGEGFLPVPYRLIYEDNSSNVMVITGQAYLNSAIFNANPINLLDGTTELTGNGPIEITDVIPDLININIISAGDNAITALLQFKLFDANGAVVFDSGMLPEANGGNLTHPFNVTGQVQKGTYSYFWQATCDSIANAFQLDAPPTKSSIFNDNTSNESSFGVQTYDFTANRTVTFTMGVHVPPPTCVAPGFTSGLNNPSITVGAPWYGTVVISGSQPFTISNVVKPATMNMSFSGNVVTFDWPVPEAGINQTISFDVTNACGSASYNDSIDVAANPDGVAVTLNYTEEAGLPSSGCVCRMYVNAALFNIYTGTSIGNNFVFNPGDVIEVQVVGPTAAVKHIDVQDTIDGEIHNQTATGITLAYSFTTVIGHDYTINASAENP